jgi:multisubunit Na+/H+ antiporter MnhG subunit
MSKTKGFRTANRRYLYVFWPSMAAYVAIIFATSYFIDKETAPLWLKVAGALAATLPILGALWAILRLVRETDEYTRLRQLTALAQGGAITAGIAFLIGFLQIFNVVGSIDIFWFGTLFFLSYGLSVCLQQFAKTV